MQIKIACVGKMKERYLVEASAEYEKRLSRFTSIEIAEVADEKTPDSMSRAEERRATEREGERLLARIDAKEHVIALVIGGKKYTSEGFAKRIDTLAAEGKQRLTFVIGGSLGLSDAVQSRANETLSLSDMTFPHRIARIVLLEQIFRAFKILRGETYHK